MRRGFSLIELVVVVVIIGIIAAIAVPRISSATLASRLNSTQANFVMFEKQIMLYQNDWQDWPPEADKPGVFPDALAGYLKKADWERGPSITGVWDWPPLSMGVFRGVSIYDDGTADASLWKAFDQAFDDGDTSTGTYQIVGSRYCRPLIGSSDGPTGLGPIGGLGATKSAGGASAD